MREVFLATDVRAKQLARLPGTRGCLGRLGQEGLILMNTESQSHLLSLSFSRGVWVSKEFVPSPPATDSRPWSDLDV